VFKVAAVAMIVVTLASITLAQRISPYGGGSTLDVHVSIAQKVKGLSYSTARHRQEATFAVSATVDQAPGAYTRVFTWSGSGIEFADIHSPNTTATLTGPGKCFPNCEVVDTNGTMTRTGSDAKACVAIGGPVTITIEAQSQRTYENDYNDSTQSFFLTYYGYSNAQAKPTYSQSTQKCSARVGPQPTGTTISWSIPTQSYSSTLQTKPHASLINIAAEGDFQDQPIAAHFSYVDPNDPTMTGTCDDDSAETHYFKSGNWWPIVYKISGHKPGSFIAERTQTGTVSHGPTDNWAGSDYSYRLADTFGGIMPGVWIQERWPSGNNLNLHVNATADPWISRLYSSIDQSVSDEDGWFAPPRPWDSLWYIWPANDTSSKTTEHEYFAGTSDTAIGATGISLGTYTITFVAGKPGTATQSKNP
jgi:hypothetical protein